MATEILTGHAVLKGIQNDGTAITLTGYVSSIINKITGTHNFEMDTVKDEKNFTAARCATDENIELTVDFTISGGASASVTTVGTRALAAAACVFPAPLATIALAHCKTQGCFGSSGNTSVKLFDGNYQYMGGASIDQSSGDFVKLTGLKIVKMADATQNTQLLTAITG